MFAAGVGAARRSRALRVCRRMSRGIMRTRTQMVCFTADGGAARGRRGGLMHGEFCLDQASFFSMRSIF